MFRSPLLVAYVPLVAAGRSSEGGGTTDPAGSTGTVSGIVSDAGGDQPIAGAMVTVGGTSVATGGDGRFGVQQVRRGETVAPRTAAASHTASLDCTASG